MTRKTPVTTVNWKKHDDYTTPKHVWENISHLIPKDKVIWEPFYCDGTSGKFFEELGFQVIHKDEDFYENNHGDVIISNPPYSDKKKVFTKLKEIGKPFIMLVPATTIHSNYFQDLFMKEERSLMHFIVPKKRINFNKVVEGEEIKKKSSAPFDCYYICWKFDLGVNNLVFL